MNPAPEPTWKYRRAYVYALTLLACVGIGVALARMSGADAKIVALALVGLVALISTYYLIAPTAENIVATVQAWRAQK
jgi:hypothetical protein